MLFKIYRVLNLYDGKSYIGKTERTIEERFAEHCKADTILGKDIRKLGVHNFQLTELYSTANLKNLSNKENYFIKEYHTLVSENGYNKRLNKEHKSWLQTYLILSIQKFFNLFVRKPKVNKEINFIPNIITEESFTLSALIEKEKKSDKIIDIQTHAHTGIEKVKIGVTSKKSRQTHTNKFEAQIWNGTLLTWLGAFKTEEDAQIAYDIAVVNTRNKIQRLNFPENMSIYKGIKIDFDKNVQNEMCNALEKFYSAKLYINSAEYAEY